MAWPLPPLFNRAGEYVKRSSSFEAAKRVPSDDFKNGSNKKLARFANQKYLVLEPQSISEQCVQNQRCLFVCALLLSN